MKSLQRIWHAWCRYWNPAWEPPLESDVMVGSPLRPATCAERATLLRTLQTERRRARRATPLVSLPPRP